MFIHLKISDSISFIFSPFVAKKDKVTVRSQVQIDWNLKIAMWWFNIISFTIYYSNISYVVGILSFRSTIANIDIFSTYTPLGATNINSIGFWVFSRPNVGTFSLNDLNGCQWKMYCRSGVAKVEIATYCTFVEVHINLIVARRGLGISALNYLCMKNFLFNQKLLFIIMCNHSGWQLVEFLIQVV